MVVLAGTISRIRCDSFVAPCEGRKCCLQSAHMLKKMKKRKIL